jgi:hypothetical protein
MLPAEYSQVKKRFWNFANMPKFLSAGRQADPLEELNPYGGARGARSVNGSAALI